jgi:GAF domain-containing protein
LGTRLMATPNSVLGAYMGISYKSPEEKVLRLLIELGAQVAGVREGSLLVLDEKKGELVFAMTVGSSSSEKELVGQRVPLGEGIVGLAAQTHEVQIGAPTFDTEQTQEPKAVIAAPMLVGDRLIGVITAVSFQPDKRFNSNDAMLYARVATVAGVVVEQHRRLSSLEVLQEGLASPKAISEDERLDQEIVGSVKRLVRAKPDAKARIAQVLSDIETLTVE